MATITTAISEPRDEEAFARRFSDQLRILMYGDCDLMEQIKLLGEILAEYDGVPADSNANELLRQLKSLKGFRRNVMESLNSGDGTYKP
jgi:hypothetical protein